MIFYLTSREGKFYTLWQLDLEHKTEKRYGEDVLIELTALGDQKLIAVTDPDQSDYYAKMISTIDPKSFTALKDREWQSAGGWLYRQDGVLLTLRSTNHRLVIEADHEYHPLLLQENVLWLESGPGRSSCR